MAEKSNDQIAFGGVSDHDYLKALIAAGVLPPTVTPGFIAAEIEGIGSNEPGFDTAGRAIKDADPRTSEEASEAEDAARAELRGTDDPAAPASSVDARTLDPESEPKVEFETPVSVGVEDGGPPADAEGSATPDATATEDPRTVEQLQDELRAEGKPVSGTKAELIARLEEE